MEPTQFQYCTTQPVASVPEQGNNWETSPVRNYNNDQIQSNGGSVASHETHYPVRMSRWTMKTKAQMKADCLSICSPDLSMAVILPEGLLSNRIKGKPSPYNGPDVQPGLGEPQSDTTEEISLVPCSVCGKTYQSRRSFLQHFKQYHQPNPKKRVRSVFEDMAGMDQLAYDCPQCIKRFASQTTLRQHLRFHSRAEATSTEK